MHFFTSGDSMLESNFSDQQVRKRLHVVSCSFKLTDDNDIANKEFT
jgi:hypothetical protein